MRSFKVYALALVAGLALVLSGVSARAADSWSGFNVGVSVGGGGGSADTEFTDAQSQTFMQIVPGTTVTQTFVDNGAGDLEDSEANGAVVELFGGYDHLVNPNFLIGAQVRGTAFSDIELSAEGVRASDQTQTTIVDVGGVVTTTTATSTSTDTFEISEELSSMITFAARAGFLPNEQWLLYVLAGAAIGHFEPSDEDDFGESQWELGFAFGGGVEYRLNEHWSLRGEFVHVNIDYDRSDSSSFSQSQTQPTSTFTNVSDFSRDQSTDFSDNMGVFSAVFRF